MVAAVYTLPGRSDGGGWTRSTCWSMLSRCLRGCPSQWPGGLSVMWDSCGRRSGRGLPSCSPASGCRPARCGSRRRGWRRRRRCCARIAAVWPRTPDAQWTTTGPPGISPRRWRSSSRGMCTAPGIVPGRALGRRPHVDQPGPAATAPPSSCHWRAVTEPERRSSLMWPSRLTGSLADQNGGRVGQFEVGQLRGPQAGGHGRGDARRCACRHRRRPPPGPPGSAWVSGSTSSLRAIGSAPG